MCTHLYSLKCFKYGLKWLLLLLVRMIIIENKRKRKDRQTLGPYPRTKENVEHVDDGNTHFNWCTWNGLWRPRKNDWKNWKSEEESRPSRPQHFKDLLEYWEESWRPEKMCWHLDSSERLPAKAGVKNFEEWNNNNNNNNSGILRKQTDHLISIRRPDLMIINKTKKEKKKKKKKKERKKREPTE